MPFNGPPRVTQEDIDRVREINRLEAAEKKERSAYVRVIRFFKTHPLVHGKVVDPQPEKEEESEFDQMKRRQRARVMLRYRRHVQNLALAKEEVIGCIDEDRIDEDGQVIVHLPHQSLCESIGYFLGYFQLPPRVRPVSVNEALHVLDEEFGFDFVKMTSKDGKKTGCDIRVKF